jgi:uncharacterized tellurite resistance protein B-like protein
MSARSGSDETETVCRLLVAFSMIDGQLDDKELKLLKEFSEDFGYSDEQLEGIVETISDQNTAEFAVTECLSAISDPETRELVAAAIFEICQADQVIHPNEKAFLEIVAKHWDVTIDFISKPIEWDEDQIEIIEAPSSDRVLVSAGPGMGKTAVACARVAHLIEKERISPSNIWMISFTRAAVSELGDRIGAFAADAQSVLGVSIATIDSKAWQIRSGFDAPTATTLFGSYDTAIDRALEMIEENQEDYEDFFSQMEHLIIDEAQDINGLRAKFLLKVIDLLDDDCGITVFHDPAQAIYDYELRDSGGDTTKLVEEMKRLEFFSSGERSLKKIHRTDDPALLRLYEDLRIDVLAEATDRFDEQKSIVEQAAHDQIAGKFEARNLAAYQSALVLFRTRAQTIMASSFLCSEGIQHRLRMANYPRCLCPWSALVFGVSDEREITEDQFFERIRELHAMGCRDVLGLSHPDPDVFSETVWRKLGSEIRRGRGDGSRIELFRVADRLSRFPIDSFMRREIGTIGPILGTIHSSKGREADEVILNIPKSWSAGADQNMDASEEGRVLFVGASRAKKRLITTPGLSAQYAQSLDSSGRVFRKSPRYTACQVQIGLSMDIETDARRLSYGMGELLGMDLPLKCVAELIDLGGGEWAWALWPEDDELDRGPIGYFSKSFTNDISAIGRVAFNKWRASKTIKNIYVIDWRTVARKPESVDSSLPASKYFGLAPVVAGFPMVFYRG